MEIGTYRIADLVFEIHSLYHEVQDLCAPYRCNAEAQFQIIMSPADIVFEQQRNRKENGPDITFPESYMETHAVYRKISDIGLAHQILLFHGSAICVDGAAYLFTARSGTGKSTHTRLCHGRVIIDPRRPERN